MMINVMRIIGILVILTGCSATAGSKQVLLPTINVTQENIGHGMHIRLDLDDLRTDKTIGYERDDGELKPVPSDQDISQIIYYQMIEALKAKDFVVDNNLGREAPALKIEIRALRYVVEPHFLTKELAIETNFKAIATNGLNTFGKGFKTEKTVTDFSLRGSKKDRARVTKVISTALTDLANDHQLLTALAGNSRATGNNSRGAPQSLSPSYPPAGQEDTGGGIETRPLDPY